MKSSFDILKIIYGRYAVNKFGSLHQNLKIQAFRNIKNNVNKTFAGELILVE